MKILLVEDNPGDARLLREVLREEGPGEFEVVTVDRLADAHRELGTSGFDIVLLDLSLPDSSGLDTLRLTLPHAPQTPIIVLTGLDDERIALRAVQAGAQDYLVKGDIEGRLLLKSLRYARERKRLETEMVHALEREQEARAAAEAAVRARDEVMGIVSHDLGNSLSAIGVHCRLLGRAGPGDATEVQKRTAAIRQLVEQMHRLRQDLIDVVSLESGKLAIQLELQPLEPVLEEALETLGDLAHGKRLELKQEKLSNLPAVWIDRQRILQVLSNLLGNAVKFTPEEGRITLGARADESEVIVTVQDTGMGISPQDVVQVFEPFWRKERGERGGAGLGLAIARGIVETHHGRIWVESRPGEGSAFRFTLPIRGANDDRRTE
jgi:phosphoserine phosphatase RsbU/P